MRKTLSQKAIAVGVLILGMTLSAQALADFKRDYGQGRKALNGGKLEDAIEDLQKAIDDEPEAQAQVRIYGMRFEPYIPYFYLGKAYFEMGNCEAAVTAWQESINQGLITQQPQYEELQRDMASCQSHTVDLSGYIASANSAIDNLDAANGRFASLQSEPLLARDWASQWGPELERSTGMVNDLRSRLQSADAANDQAAMEAVQADAVAARNAIDGAGDRARSRMQTLAADQERQARESERQAREQRDGARRELDSAIAAAGDVQAVPDGSPQMANLKEQLDNQLTMARGLNDNATAVNMQEVARGLTNIMRRYQQAEQDWRVEMQAIQDRTPPPLLRDIALAYFAGEYRQAEQLADPSALDEDREKIQALLFRAAASHKLFVLSGESDRTLLSQAEDDIRTIKQLNPRFSPYIAAFSPHFLTLFRETG